MNNKILGMGNAVLDILTETTEEYLKNNKLDKGSMVLVEQEESDKIISDIIPKKKDSGGSVANTTVGISILGGDSLFCGKVKNDELGIDFEKNMQNAGTRFLCQKSENGLPTARCLVLVTPDGERTMQTFLGASTTLEENDIKEEFFQDVNFLLIEGYLWSSVSARNAIQKAIEISKKKDIKIFFSLSDPGLAKMYRNDFLKFIDNSVDVLIGNEKEYYEVFQNEKHNILLKDVLNLVDVGLMTQGDKGVMLFKNEEIMNIGAPKINNVIDTTGAGDMFAAGLLFKLQRNESFEKSAEFGCKTAAKIITQFGARPTNQFKSLI
ncbi:MAG: adenosine kinase [Alphaproteobacteria bacterium]